MSILLLGASYRSASTDVLERLSLVGADAVKALHELVASESVAEAAIVSTCNRVEVVTNTTTFHGGVAEITDVLARHSGLPLSELQPHLYPLHDARAVQHLFSVTCGLDSLLVGEAQIQGQVRASFKLAQEEGTTGRVLGELFRHAVRVGRRVRTDTGIDRAGRSLVAVGLRLAVEVVGPLEGSRALLIGAGSTGALAASELRRAHAGPITIANRSAERAERVLGDAPGHVIGLAGIGQALGEVDIVVASTSAGEPVLDVETLEAALAVRRGRPLFILDLGLPRDVEAGARCLPGVVVADLDSLRSVLAKEPAGADEAEARLVVDAEVGAFLGWQRARQVAPTVVALRAKAENLAAGELDRLAARLPHLDEASWGEITLAVQRVVDKLLHAPTVRVKQLAEVPGGTAYAEALRELFELDRGAVEAVSLPTLQAHVGDE